MSNSPEKEDGTPREPLSGAPSDAGRRRLLQGGLGAAPVVLTLASRPVLGQQVCLSPSAFWSGNLSGQTIATCQGKTPLDWNTATVWPTGYKPGNPNATRFNAALGTTSQTAMSGNPMLKDVLASTSSVAMQQVARYVGASMLNVATPGLLGTPSVLTLPMLKNMWAEYRMTNGFRPTSGAPAWTWTQIVNYLKTTMVAPPP